jgi:hypothetical protein
MHTPLPTNTASDTTDPLPTAMQVYQSQLEDYELLLSFMRGEVGSITQFANTLLKPRTFSPLSEENEAGQLALQELMKDSDYLAACRAKNVSPHYLIVTLEDSIYRYQTSNRENQDKVTLELDETGNLPVLKSRIEKTVRLMAGQIRYDRLVALPRMATFYGMSPWDPTNAVAHQTSIYTLEEKISSYRLRLEDEFSMLDLSSGFLEKARSVSLPESPSENSDSEINNQLIVDAIRQTIQAFLPDETSLLTHLANDILSSTMLERIRAQPTVYLEKILQTPEARKLEGLLLSALDWYGATPGEEASPYISTKLLANALQIWFERRLVEFPDRIAGFDLHSRAHWGKSHKEIWKQFEEHLLTSKRAASEKEAVVMARLYLNLFPSEFRVANISTELPYRSSIAWVNFAHGAYLANAINPRLLDRLSFQQLIDLPTQYATEGSAENLKLIALTRVKPTLEWAVTNGLVSFKSDANYTTQEATHAAKKLDAAINSLKQTIGWLDITPPDRLNIAKLKVQRLFGDHLFIDDGRKLVEESSSYTTPPIRFSGPVDRLAPDTATFIDAYASGKLDGEKKWFITAPDGKIVTDLWIRIGKDRSVQTNLDWSGLTSSPPETKSLPDIESTFNTHFKIYLDVTRSAYRSLITHQLASLPLADRKALEFGDVKIYTLRKATTGIEAENESEKNTLPLRARKGFILETTYGETVSYYELLPRAGVIRRRTDIQPHHIGGQRILEKWKISSGSPVNVTVLRHKNLPFDWDAHEKGAPPRANTACQAIMDQLGSTLERTGQSEEHENIPRTLESRNIFNLANYISQNFLFIDENKLFDSCYGKTKFDRKDAQRDKAIEAVKMLVPFWSSIEDLSSGDRDRMVRGVFGVFADFASFILPIGKFASGSLKLINVAGKMSIRVTLPSFAKLTGTLLTSTLNPFDGIPSLLKAGGQSVFKLSKKGLFNLKMLTGRAGQYDFTQSMPQVTQPGRWRPLEVNDQLATCQGIEDILVRNIAPRGKSDFRLIDPTSSKPYGPSLIADSFELSLGRSRYSTLAHTDTHAIVEVPAKTQVREIFEIDKTRTFYLDDIPYRLKDGKLCRINNTDTIEKLKKVPCRTARALDGVCLTRFVLDNNPAERPPIGEFNQENSWASWFGDNTYYPSTPQAPNERSLLSFEGKIYELKNGTLNTYKGKPEWIGLKSRTPIPRKTVSATIEFQNGIFGGIKVTGTAEKINDTHITGAIIAPSIDGKSTYVFTRLNINDYYLVKLSPEDSLQSPLNLKKLEAAELAPRTLGEELQRVYVGSLNANNMVRTYGREKVELILDKLDEIAKPIGAPIDPALELKHVNVAAYSASSLLFDRRTRIITAELPDGAAVWKPISLAPETIQTSTTHTFNTLFTTPSLAGSSNSAGRSLTINDAMQELQKILPTQNPKNIAFAEVTTASGNIEIYVSVSGISDYTSHIPLFKRNKNATEVVINDVTYFNVDKIRNPLHPVSLSVSTDGKLLAIPHPMDAFSDPDVLNRVTSGDSESKLIGYISEKYPKDEDIKSITVATTLPPCDSCAIVMKEFGHERGATALNVIWGKRRKRPAPTSSDSQSSSSSSISSD